VLNSQLKPWWQVRAQRDSRRRTPSGRSWTGTRPAQNRSVYSETLPDQYCRTVSVRAVSLLQQGGQAPSAHHAEDRGQCLGCAQLQRVGEARRKRTRAKDVQIERREDGLHL